MDNSKLAQKMLEWEQRKRELDALENEIANAVLDIGKTQTVGNVRATYSAGRRKFDYKAFIETADNDGLLSPGSLGQYKIWSYDYKQAVEDAGIDLQPYVLGMDIDYTAAAKALQKGIEMEIPFTRGEPSVTLKLL